MKINKFYKIFIGFLFIILIINLFPEYWSHIFAAFIAAFLIEFTIGDSIKYISLKHLKSLKYKFLEYWFQIKLNEIIRKEKYDKYQTNLIEKAIGNAKSNDKSKRQLGLDQLTQFEGEDIYFKLLDILKNQGVHMPTNKILWIEDDADLLWGLVKPLEKDGYKIISAKDEKEGLEKISEIDFDLIILDIIIPTGIKGDEGGVSFVGMRLLEKLLIEMKIKIPIIVLSVVRDSNMIEIMYQMGVKKVLPKGAYLPSKLKNEIYEVLGILQ